MPNDTDTVTLTLTTRQLDRLVTDTLLTLVRTEHNDPRRAARKSVFDLLNNAEVSA